MKKLIYLPVYLGMLFFSAACENWFDVSPKSDVKAEDLFQQESGFRDVLTGVYSLMSAPESYGRQLSFGYVDVLAQYYNISGNTHRYIKTKDYLYREPYDKEVLSTIWSRQYKGIANLNAMLMFIDEQRGVFSGDEVYRIYKGEILALRGMLHFDMLRLFSASPAIDKERKAIPYLESYTNLPQHQLTVGAVLEKVVKDLNAARELMREVDPYGPNYAKLESLYRNHPLLRNRLLWKLPGRLWESREVNPSHRFHLLLRLQPMSVYSTVSCCLLWRKGKCRIISMFISGSRL